MSAQKRFGIAALSIVLAAAWLVPMLRVPHVPSVDGPVYLALGVALRELATDPGSPLHRSLELQTAPTPFWTAPVLVALLTAVLTPAAAEKVLYAIELLAVPFALALLRRAVHGRAGAVALLGFPLGAHLLFRAGFHGFSLGVPVVLLALAWWWRHRRSDGLGWAVGLALLVVLAWFTHLFAWAVAVGAVAGSALVLRDSTRRGALATAAALALCVPLFAAPSTPKTTDVLAGPAPFGWERARMLVQGDALAGVADPEQWCARATVVLLVALAAASLRRRRGDEPPPPPVLPLVLGAVAAAVALLATPRGFGPGGIYAPRFALLALLMVAAAVREPRTRAARAAVAAAVVALGAAQAAIATPAYAAGSALTERFLAGLAPLARGERLLTMRAPGVGRSRLVVSGGDLTRHAAAWRAAEAGAVDLGTHFIYHQVTPVLLRPELRGVPRPLQRQAYGAGPHLALADVVGWADVVYLWEFRPAEVARRAAGTPFVPRTLGPRSALLEAPTAPR